MVCKAFNFDYCKVPIHDAKEQGKKATERIWVFLKRKTGWAGSTRLQQASLSAFNLLKLGACGRCLSRRHIGLSNTSCYKTKLDSSLAERKYGKEDHDNKTFIQYESKRLKKKKQGSKLSSPTASLKARLTDHPLALAEAGAESKRKILPLRMEMSSLIFIENHMLLIPNMILG